jgi:kynureninase
MHGATGGSSNGTVVLSMAVHEAALNIHDGAGGMPALRRKKASC